MKTQRLLPLATALPTTILSIQKVESFFDLGGLTAAAKTNTNKSFAGNPPPSKVDRTQNPQWLDTLKYDGEPTFDVLQKTIDYASKKTYEERASFNDDEYVFRGPIIGPITFQDVKRT